MKLWILLEEMQEELEFLNPRIYNSRVLFEEFLHFKELNFVNASK
jgi:hypothetical protein